jgi:histone-lysine N-methyltransferase SETMAR
MLLHDNARPHAAARTQAMLQEFGWEAFEHPAYSPDLAPNDFHLFPKLKKFLGGRRFKSDKVVKDAVKEWLNGLAAEVYDEGIQKLVTCYDKCLNVGGDCVEKYLRVCNNDTLNYFYFVYFSLYPNGLYFMDDPRIKTKLNVY